MKVAKSVKLKPIPGSQMPDGSYLTKITGKIEDPAGSTNGRKKWIELSIVVRVICFQINGFRPVRLITSILEPKITAKELIVHYHKRWDIEIAYDEIKTHQCATLRGQAPTILRSKRSDLVEQELYAILITYNLMGADTLISRNQGKKRKMSGIWREDNQWRKQYIANANRVVELDVVFVLKVMNLVTKSVYALIATIHLMEWT